MPRYLTARCKTYKSRRWELVATLGAICETPGLWKVGIYDVVRDSHGAWSVTELRKGCLITHAFRSGFTEALKYINEGKKTT